METASDELKTNRRLREGSLSTGTGSCSDAKHCLTLKTARWFEHRVASSIIDSTPPSWGDQRVFLIDETTFCLVPVPSLQKQYPPASNRHGEGVWPIVHIVFAHELSSGASLPPEIGAMYGPDAVSETKLDQSLIKHLPPRSIVMADVGFGIFSTAYHAKQNGHNFVMRLSRCRFNRIRKNAEFIDIRNIKLVLGTEEIRAKSTEMFLKEFALSMVAYNLTTQIRRESAKIADCVPRGLSFTGICSAYRHTLQGIEVTDPSEWNARLERAMKYGAQQITEAPRKQLPSRSVWKTT